MHKHVGTNVYFLYIIKNKGVGLCIYYLSLLWLFTYEIKMKFLSTVEKRFWLFEKKMLDTVNV